MFVYVLSYQERFLISNPCYVILKVEVTLSEAELVAWSKANMADYKYPRIIEFRETLPMTATGKILKSELR